MENVESIISHAYISKKPTFLRYYEEKIIQIYV